MREKGPVVILVAAVLTFLGLRGFPPESAESARSDPRGGQAATEPRSAERKEAGDAFPLDKEADGPLGPANDFQHAGTGVVSEWEARSPDVPGWPTRYLIACVPDPQESSSGYRFDSLVDAIQRAAETQGYVLDRYYYPWRAKKPTKAAPTPAPTDAERGGTLTLAWLGLRKGPLASRGKPTAGTWRTDPKRCPGVLLFRASSSREPIEDSCIVREELLQVFLVGETATAGIHKQAFTTSLHLISKSRAYQEQPALFVLGPHFSGSQVSLQRALQAWDGPASPKTKPPHFTIISGSATAVDRKTLEASLPGRVAFHATRVPEEKVFQTTLQYLGVMDGQPAFKERIAILHESNTAFGMDTKNITLQDKSSRSQPAYFPFPLHVSDVRSAYEKTSGTKGGLLSLPSFGSKLQLPLTRGQPRDTEPPLDHEMAAVTTERILGSMLSTIARERMRYAVILASDVKDKLFLARLLRQRCPETRLILSGNDLLFSHPDFSAALRGAIVGSTYPLYLRNQHWSHAAPGDTHQHLVFPGEEEQGVFNATRALLGLSRNHACPLLEYSPPFPELLKDKRVDLHRPPIWISIIGQGGPFPLTAIPSPQPDQARGTGDGESIPLTAGLTKPSRAHADTDYVFRPTKETSVEGTFTPLHPTLWIVLVLGVSVLLTWVFLSYFFALWQSSPGRKPLTDGEHAWELQKLFWPRKGSSASESFRWRQRYYSFVCLMAVLVLHAYLTYIWLIPAFSWWMFGDSVVPMHKRDWIMPLSMGILLLLIGVAFVGFKVIPMVRTVWSWDWRQAPEFLLILAVIAILSILMVWESWWQWAWACFSRRARSATRRPSPRNPPGFLGGGTSSGGACLLARFRPFLAPFCLLLLVVFLLGVPAACYFIRTPPQPERAGALERLLYFERVTSLASGVSPVVPVFLLAMAFFCWGYVQLKRLYLLGQPHAVEEPFPQRPYFSQLNERHDQLHTALHLPERALERPFAWIAGMALFFTFCRLASHFVPSVEWAGTEILILLGLAVLAVLIVCGWLHLYRVWKSTRELLAALALLPRGLGAAFQRIPSVITDLFGPLLSSERPGWRGQWKARLDRLERFGREYANVRTDLSQPLGKDDTELQALGKSLNTALARLDAARSVQKSVEVELRSMPDVVRDVARECFALLGRIWDDPALAARFAESPSSTSPEPAPHPAYQVVKKLPTGPGSDGSAQLIEDITPQPHPDQRLRAWLALVQDFLALEVVVYLSQFFVHLRNLILFLTLAPLLMLLAVTSYPFQPQSLWLLLTASLLGVGTATVIGIIVQIERNVVVSHILSTTPNQLDFHWEFLGQVLVYAAPLLGIVVATSSDVSDLVHALIDPLIQVLR